MRLLIAAVFALAAGAIVYGVRADAREASRKALLEEIRSAEENLAYAGTRRVAGTRTVTLKVWSRDGRQRVEIDGLGRRGAVLPAFLRPGHGQWSRRVKDPGLAARNYDLSVAGRETVAGRAAEVIELRPRRRDRATYLLSVDAENRFPLRVQVLAKGTRLLDAAFEEIAFDAPFAEPPAPRGVSIETERVPLEEAAKRAGFPVWVPSRLPAGFRLRDVEILKVRLNLPLFDLPRTDASIVHLNATDGMAVLSIVQTSSRSPLWGLARRFLGAGPPPDGPVPAWKFANRAGAAYFLEMDATGLLVAGNASPAEIEAAIRSLER